MSEERVDHVEVEWLPDGTPVCLTEGWTLVVEDGAIVGLDFRAPES